ncbi:hypothetical protein, partial [Streptomyces sp. NPDC002057]|uniref:hypothetical protein n=1 Tax=Streptomyces sp. NPDC002057 TaxID=3154664 RepID=UPI0033219262
PVTNLAEAVNAVPRITGHPYMDIVRKAYVLDALKGTVGVPDTGTYVVADGVVHEASARYVKERMQPGGRLWKWTLEAEEPRPAFFEVGKTYRREYRPGKKQTFSVELVRVENGEPFALGRCVTDDYGVDWVVRRQHHWDALDWTEEVR